MPTSCKYLSLHDKYAISSFIISDMKKVAMWKELDVALVHSYLIDCFAASSKTSVLYQLIPKTLVKPNHLQHMTDETISEEELNVVNKLKEAKGYELLQQHVVYKLLDV